MKFTKLTKKLLLSALSLGLAVVTLTTTTFAWYTSSTDASAAGGQGSTSGQTSDSSLMISGDKGVSWGPTATITSSEFDLIPVQWNATAGKFQVLGANDGVYAEDSYYEFELWFQTTGSSEDVDVYLTSMLIENDDDELTAFPTLYNSTATTTTGCPTTSYAVDVVRALDMIIEIDEVATAYDLSDKFEDEYLDHVGDFVGGTPNAINYYKNVMGETSLGSGADNITTEYEHDKVLGTIDSAEGSILKVTFKIFLNGWDQYCFDACRGQKFNVSMNFSTNKPVAPEEGE